MTDRERQIEALKKLDLSDEEIAELLAEDDKIDKMDKSSEINSDLTDEQKEGLKSVTREHSGKYEKSEATIEQEERKRQEKATAMDSLMEAVDVVEIVKPGAEFIFMDNGIKFRCNIKRVRKQ